MSLAAPCPCWFCWALPADRNQGYHYQFPESVPPSGRHFVHWDVLLPRLVSLRPPPPVSRVFHPSFARAALLLVSVAYAISCADVRPFPVWRPQAIYPYPLRLDVFWAAVSIVGSDHLIILQCSSYLPRNEFRLSPVRIPFGRQDGVCRPVHLSPMYFGHGSFFLDLSHGCLGDDPTKIVPRPERIHDLHRRLVDPFLVGRHLVFSTISCWRSIYFRYPLGLPSRRPVVPAHSSSGFL